MMTLLQIQGFQFYDSPIKSEKQSGEYEVMYLFQFYDSPIKSCARQTAYEGQVGFNSMIVRLKVVL